MEKEEEIKQIEDTLLHEQDDSALQELCNLPMRARLRELKKMKIEKRICSNCNGDGCMECAYSGEHLTTDRTLTGFSIDEFRREVVKERDKQWWEAVERLKEELHNLVEGTYCIYKINEIFGDLQ